LTLDEVEAGAASVGRHPRRSHAGLHSYLLPLAAHRADVAHVVLFDLPGCGPQWVAVIRRRTSVTARLAGFGQKRSWLSEAPKPPPELPDVESLSVGYFAV
jgi:hypothetical protein